MLIALSIRDFILVRGLDLEPGTGFTALTGETGAGKSVILSALGAALGARTDKALVRKGAKAAVLSATFDLPEDHPLWMAALENGLELDPTEPIIFRRLIKKAGAARGWINDAPVSARLMQDIGSLVIDIQGQHAGQGLLNPARHRALLDSYANASEELENCAQAWLHWRNAKDALDVVRDRLERAQAEREFLSHAVEELDKLDPQPGEADSLAAERVALQSHEKTAQAVSEVAKNFDRGGPEQILASAARALGRLTATPVIENMPSEHALKQSLTESMDAIERALIEAGEAAELVRRLEDMCAYSPDELEQAETRLFALRAAGRKFDVDPDQLDRLRDRMRSQLDEIEHSDRALAAALETENQAGEAYRVAADSLTEKRRESSEKLAEAVQGELEPLKLGNAQFRVALNALPEDSWGPGGCEAALFEIQTNKGGEFGALNQIASGGEMARLFLALQLCLASAGKISTLVFDEVDVGVGGAVAAAIGARLMQLGAERQVFAITHSPQVAASANAHWRIRKADLGDEATETKVDGLSPKDRMEEIARMLAGADVTREARAAAGKLLAHS